MKFTVTDASGTVLGTIDVTEEVYADDDALLAVLARANYVDRDAVLEIHEDEDNQIDIYECEFVEHGQALDVEHGIHRVSLVLIH